MLHAKARRRLIPAAAALFLAGCGAPEVLVHPSVDHPAVSRDDLRRSDVALVAVTDARAVPGDVAGTAKTGMMNQEVPVRLVPGTEVFVDSVLTRLLVDPRPADRATPLRVHIDELAASEHQAFTGEKAKLRCALRFEYPASPDSLVTFPAAAEREASSLTDVTEKIEGLLLESLADCAAQFHRDVLAAGTPRALLARDGRAAEATPALAAFRAETAPPDPARQDAPATSPPGDRFDEGAFEWGAGAGFGSLYGFLGARAYAGTEHLQAFVASGTIPFAWRRTLRAGATATLRDRYAAVRPRVSVLWMNNASEVSVWEPRVEGELQSLVDYDPFPGIAVLAGVVILPTQREGARIDIEVGWRFPFDGMDAVNAKADEYYGRYFQEGNEITVPRWDHLTVSVGLDVSLSAITRK